MKKKLLENNLINENKTIKDALIRLNELGVNLTLFVVDANNVLLGSVTDGDIRRSLVADVHIRDGITKIMSKDFKFLRENDISIEDIKKLKSSNVIIVPILNSDNQIIEFINIKESYSILPIDAVIMAGGRGERLKPLTNNIPKPLLKVDGVPIIERNIDRLIDFGINNITVSIKYLGDQIVDYFLDGASKHVSINYINEIESLGTIGAIKLIKEFKHNEILVMNSDLLTNIDFEAMYELFKESNADMVVASTSYDVSIPYAVLEIENGSIKSFKEKPSYSYHSNAGIYLIKRDVIDLIPNNELYNATDLIEELIKSGKKVLNFPILGYWLDIGKHEDFDKAQNDVKRIKF